MVFKGALCKNVVVYSGIKWNQLVKAVFSVVYHIKAPLKIPLMTNTVIANHLLRLLFALDYT